MDKKSTVAKWFKNTGFTLSLSLYLLALFVFISFSANVFSSSIKELKNQQITEILFNIHTYYVEDLALQNTTHTSYNNQQFAHLYAQLDPYSKYLDEHELNALFDNTNGRYTGLGIEVKQINNSVTIVNVVSNSPAKSAGVMAGDIIINVNNQTTQHSSVEHV
ncbi:MAG: S41 family peptidase, partial [Pseudoalteromonas nigrifaciens]